MATILVTHGIPAEGFSLLSGEKIVIPKPLMQFSTDELAALIPAADAVVACGALPGEIIRRGRKLRIIAGYGAGYDGVDVRAAAECGIPVTNLPDTVTDSTAELAIGLMLAVSRRIGENSLRARGSAGKPVRHGQKHGAQSARADAGSPRLWAHRQADSGNRGGARNALHRVQLARGESSAGGKRDPAGAAGAV